jgi:hypothetical protein
MISLNIVETALQSILIWKTIKASSNKLGYHARKNAHVRELPLAKVFRQTSRLHPGQDLALAHRLVSRLEGLPEILATEIGYA